MITTLSLFLGCLFAVLAALHFYWVGGGSWGLKGAMLPEMWEQVTRPGRALSFRLLTLTVGLGLLGMGYIMLSHLGGWLPGVVLAYRSWIVLFIALIFAARGIGDFNRIGIFQQGQTGVFAERDKSFYSPLCLVLALSSGTLWWLTG